MTADVGWRREPNRRSLRLTSAAIASQGPEEDVPPIDVGPIWLTGGHWPGTSATIRLRYSAA